MFGWLRDALTNVPSSFLSPSTPISPPTPSSLQQQQTKDHSSSSDDEEEKNPSNENSFYHNPYHSSGQMNYVDLPQQQFTNEHTYPTYLAKQQTSTNINQSLDDQIHTKLLSLQRRSNQYQSYQHRQNNYAFRNRIIPNDSTSHFSKTDQRSDDDDDEEEEDDNLDESSKLGNYPGISEFYSEQYSNIDEQFDFASVVIWYKNVMQSVKKFL